jgi:hypothetical protein
MLNAFIVAKKLKVKSAQLEQIQKDAKAIISKIKRVTTQTINNLPLAGVVTNVVVKAATTKKQAAEANRKKLAAAKHANALAVQKAKDGEDDDDDDDDDDDGGEDEDDNEDKDEEDADYEEDNEDKDEEGEKGEEDKEAGGAALESLAGSHGEKPQNKKRKASAGTKKVGRDVAIIRQLYKLFPQLRRGTVTIGTDASDRLYVSRTFGTPLDMTDMELFDFRAVVPAFYSNNPLDPSLYQLDGIGKEAPSNSSGTAPRAETID